MICSEDFVDAEWISLLLCRHIFHTFCINKWCRIHVQNNYAHCNCPTCRTNMN